MYMVTLCTNSYFMDVVTIYVVTLSVWLLYVYRYSMYAVALCTCLIYVCSYSMYVQCSPLNLNSWGPTKLVLIMRCSNCEFALNIKCKYNRLSRDHNHLSELTGFLQKQNCTVVTYFLRRTFFERNTNTFLETSD